MILIEGTTVPCNKTWKTQRIHILQLRMAGKIHNKKMIENCPYYWNSLSFAVRKTSLVAQNHKQLLAAAMRTCVKYQFPEHDPLKALIYIPYLSGMRNL